MTDTTYDPRSWYVRRTVTPLPGVTEDAPQEWRPIETAPKDMRPILVFVRASRVPFQELPDMIHVAFLKRPGVYAMQDEDHMLVDPTHWMPLPEPPTP